MPVGEIYDLRLSGIYCGVPVAISLAYKQVEPDPALPETPGRRLVEAWFTEANGPWTWIVNFISEQLSWECAVVTYGSTVETILLQNGMGVATTPSLPTTQSLQVDIPGSAPHRSKRPGRFYMPGFLVEHVERGAWKSTALAILRTWMVRLEQVDNDGGAFRFLLYPHYGYRDVGGGTSEFASNPYFHPFVKVIANRQADDCGTFAATQNLIFNPIEVRPSP